MDPADDTAAIFAAITVMRHLQGRLDALDAKLDLVQTSHIAMRKDFHSTSRRNQWLGIIFGMVKHGWVFSSQLSIIWCAGYVWFAHQKYVEEVAKWIGIFLGH